MNQLRNTPFATGGCVCHFRVLVVQIEIAASLAPCRCNLVSAPRGSGGGSQTQQNQGRKKKETQAAGEASWEAAARLSRLESSMSWRRKPKVWLSKEAACVRAAIVHKAQLGIWEAGEKTLSRKILARGKEILWAFRKYTQGGANPHPRSSRLTPKNSKIRWCAGS